MNAQRHRFAERRAVMRWIEALVVQPMASFVDAAEKARREIVLMDPSSDAHVSGVKRRRERMCGKIQPALLEIISHGNKHQPAEFQLPRLIVSMIEKTVVDLEPTLLNFREQWDQSGLHLCEQRRQRRHR